MSEQEWPADEAFRRYAAWTADAVMWARNNGWSVTPCINDDRKPGECCPLGAWLAFFDRCRPAKSYKIEPYPAAYGQSLCFAAGFDGHPEEVYNGSPYYRLGREYRRRALGEVKWGER
jgi:hypothetical protein